MAQNRIQFDVGFNVNKADLNTLASSLQKIQQEAIKAGNAGQLTKELKEASNAAKQLESILNNSWNSKLGQLDLSRVNNSIKSTYGSVSKLKTIMENSGSAGAAAYNKFASSILNTNVQLKQSNELLNDMATTMANTVKWGITSSIFNTITNSIQKAFSYTKKLDSSLNDIRIVTGESADSMERFARQANNAAKNLGASTLDYTNASLIYYQQGLSDEEVQARAETTVKAANITGQTGEAVSEQLTAVWNGYKVTAEETEAYVDKLAAVAATTASDLEELSVGMSKVASAANAMGVDFDDLNAQIATIVSVTRQAPESVGTALKTIYARLGDLKVDGVDEFGVKLGEVSSQMQTMGIQILDQQGNLRDMSSVIAEVAQKWGTWTEAQKQAAAVAMAGKRQYNNLFALFDNWDMYTKSLNTSINAVGTLQHQQDIYMESTEAHLEQLRAQAEETYDILFDTNTVNSFASALTGALGIFNNFLEGIGGGNSAFIMLGATIARVFNQQIGTAIGNAILNTEKLKSNLDMIALKEQVITAHSAQGENISGLAVAKEAEIMKQTLLVSKGLTNEQYNQLMTLQKEVGLKEQEIQHLKNSSNYLKQANVSNKLSVATLEKIVNTKKDEVDLQKDLLTYLELGTKASNTLTEQERERVRQTEYLKNEESEEYMTLNTISQEQSDILIKLQSSNLSEEEREELIKLQNILIEKQLNTISNIEAGIEGKKAAESGYLAQLEQEQIAREKLIADEQKQAQLRQTAQASIQVLSTIAMTLTTISGIVKTLTDDTLSAGEKAEQIGTTLLFMLPMILTGFQSLQPALAGIAVELGVVGASAEMAATEAIAGIMGVETALGPVGWVLLGITAAIAGLTAAIYGTVKAYNADKTAAEEDAKQVEELKNRYEELTETVQKFKQEVSDYTDAITALDELEQGTEEYAEALQSANDKAIQLIETYELWGKYSKQNGLITFDEGVLEDIEKQQASKALESQQRLYGANIQSNISQSKSSATDLGRELGLVLAESYDGNYENRYLNSEEVIAAAQAVQDFKEANENAKMNLEDLLKVQSSLPQAIVDNAEVIIDNQDALNELANSLDEAAEANEYYAKRILGLEVEEKYGNKVRNSTRDAEGNIDEELASQIIDALAGRASKFEQERQNRLANIDVSDATTNASLSKYGHNIENDKDLALTYAEEVLGYKRDELTYKGGRNVGTIKDKEGNIVFEKLSDDVMRRQLANTAEQKKILDEIDNKFKDSGDATLSAIEKLKNSGSEFGNIYGVNFVTGILDSIANGSDKIDFSSLFESLSPEQAEALSKMSPTELANALGLSEENFQALGYNGAIDFQNAWELAWASYDPSAWQDKMKETISSANVGASSIYSKIQSGELNASNIGENEDYQALMNQLNSLVDTYPELKAEAELLNQTWLVGTQEYTEALGRVQDQLYQLDLQNAIDDASESIDSFFEKFSENGIINVDADTEEFESAMDDILNAEYAIDVKIHTEAEQEFDDISAAMENLESSASKIGENFIVAADDIRELNNAFPGIIEGMKILEDGTVELNEEMVQSAMAAAEQEAQADAQATISKLENQATLLRSKQKIYEQMANAAMILADSETHSEQESDDARATLSSGLAELKKMNSQTTANSEMANDVEVANSSNVNGGIVANNWASAFQSMASASFQAASAAIANMKAVANGGGSLSNPTINAQYSGSSGQSSEASIIEATEDAIENIADSTSEKWGELAEKYAGLADAAGAAANDIEGMIAEVGASGAELDKKLGSVSKGKGAGGSKKGGGGKDKKDKDEKEYKDEFDRYWELNKAIEETDRSMKKLQKDQKNLFGYQLIDSLKKANKLLDEQAANYKKLAEAQEAEAAELRSQLGTMGVMFDASGAITNYAAATAQALAAYNDAIQKYNAGLIDETAFGVYEKSFENFKKLIERYDNLYYKEIQETKEKLDDIRREKLANNLKAWEVELDLKLNLKELKRGWNDFLKEIREDFKKVYKDLTIETKNLQQDAKTYLGKDGSIGTTIKAIQDVTKEIDKMRGGGFSEMFESISQAQEKLRDLNDKLQDNAKGLHDLWKEAWDAYIDGIDQVSDKFDDLLDRFDKMNDELEFQGQLIELLYGEKAYDLMSKLYQGQEKSVGNQLESVKKQAEMWEKLWRDSGATMDNQTSWTEDQKKYYDQWMEAQEKLNDLVINYIKLLKDDYLNTIEKVLAELEKSLTGSSLQDVKTQWERISAYSDKYLDDVEQAYETQKLANKINESIANTSNLKNQQKLQAFRDKEIKYLREKENLTQYDLDAAEARYQIALKEMALEDARNNKTSMKLVRNEQGNWSYQYLADEEEVASKQQELLDAYNNLYQLASDAYESNLQALQDLQEKYLESAKEIYTDETLTEEEKQQKLLDLRTWYLDQYKLLAEENTLYRNDLATSSAALLLEIYEQDKEAYTAMTEEERELVDALIEANIEDYMDLEEKIKDNYKNIDDMSRLVMADTRADWTSTAQLLADLWNKDAGGSVRYEVISAYNQMVKATENYKSKLDWLAAAAERNFGSDGITGAIEKAADATDDLKYRTEDLVTDGINYLADLRRAVEEIEDAWKSVQDAIEDAIRTLEEYINMVAKANAAEASSGASIGGGGAGFAAGRGSGNGSGSGEGFGPGNSNDNSKKVVSVDYRLVTDPYGVAGTWGVVRGSTGTGGPYVEISKNKAYLQKKYGTSTKGFDTGGYTGEWNGDSGRLAMLHQKEIVLNKDDTANFLSGISMIRDMSGINGSISKAVMQAVVNMTLAIGRTKAGNINGTVVNETNQTEGNTFNITANFPNANDVNDIREAIMSLPNLATQFVARNGK